MNEDDVTQALKSVEDFTEFEQRAAYFDGDTVIAQKKGVNFLERGSEVHAMAEFQEILDFPPAPKLDPFGRLYPDRPELAGGLLVAVSTLGLVWATGLPLLILLRFISGVGEAAHQRDVERQADTDRRQADALLDVALG